MITDKVTKMFMTRSDKPNENWTDTNAYVVEDGTELAKKIEVNAPYFDFVLDGEGNLIDITLTERPIAIPIPTQDDYLLDLDYRLSLVELGL